MTTGAVHPLFLYPLLTGRGLFDVVPEEVRVAELRACFMEEVRAGRLVSPDGSVWGGEGRRMFFAGPAAGPFEAEFGRSPEPVNGNVAPGAAGITDALFEDFRRTGLVTEAPAMVPALRIIARLSGKALPIHLEGESGVGKEVIAKYIHERSSSRSGPFIAVNCGAIPQELVESELFGHKRGAYTGANKDSAGLILSAKGGTLFLDEIGDLPLTAQVKLLRVLERKAVRPVGGTEEKEVEFRLVTATNKNLEAEVKARRFREDFFYRLGTAVAIPPLRRRKSDIPLLVRHFAEHFQNDNGEGDLVTVDAAFMERLMVHDWPGNVRELKHVIEHAMAIRDANVLRVTDLPLSFQETRLDDGDNGGDLKTLTLARALELGLSPDELGLRYFRLALDLCEGNLQDVATLLGVSAATAYRRKREIEGRPLKKNGQ